MRYSKLRLFLSQREIAPVLEAMGDFEDSSRKQYLIDALSQEIRFSNKQGAQYVYAYVGSEGDYILGRVGRLKSESETQGPETAFSEERKESWYAANIIIDTSGETSGQKVAFEQVSNVGEALAVTRNLASKINENFRANWHIDANNMTVSGDFWVVVKENVGRMTSLKMNFVAPNIFRSADETSKNLKELHEENGAQNTTVIISNPDKNLNPDSDRIRENIDYLKKGGGNYTLKSGQDSLYDSDEMPDTESIDELELVFDIQQENKPLWKRLADKILKNE